MKIGIKLWNTNQEFFENAVKSYKKGEFDYLELSYISEDIEKIKIFADHNVPIIVHAKTEHQGFSFSERSLEESNAMFKGTQIFADKVNAKHIIVHPDFGKEETFLLFLKNNQDPRILIENMPLKGLHGKNSIGHDIKQLKKFLNSGPFGFCLDFVHAAKAALSLKKEYKGFINELLDLKPTMFHLCDAKFNKEVDEHLNLGEGELDLEFIKNILTKENKEVTLEVPLKNGLKNYLDNVKNLRSL